MMEGMQLIQQRDTGLGFGMYNIVPDSNWLTVRHVASLVNARLHLKVI